MIFSPPSVTIYNISKSSIHGMGQFSPVIWIADIPILNWVRPFENLFRSWRSKKIQIFNKLLKIRILIIILIIISPNTFSIGFQSTPFAGQGSNSISPYYTNQCLITLASWMEDLSCINLMRNLIYLSAFSFPLIRTKSVVPLAAIHAQTGKMFLPLRSWTFFFETTSVTTIEKSAFVRYERC